MSLNWDIDEEVKEGHLTPFGTHVLETVSTDNMEELENLLKNRGAEVIQLRDRLDRRPIHYAAMYGKARMVRRLVRAGSPVNVLDASGRAPLHMAAEAGHEEVAEALVELGAHIYSCTTRPDGETALHLAAHHGHARLLATLIRRGGHINQATQDRDRLVARTPLHYAVLARQSAAVEVLCQEGADLQVQDRLGRCCALHYAAELGDLPSLRSLLQHGASLKTPNIRYCTPLIVAIQAHQVEVVQELINHGADMMYSANCKYNAVHTAIMVNSVECLRCLLEAGGDPNMRVLDVGKGGDTPLMLSLGYGHRDTTLLLLLHGADVNVPDYKKYTPLHRCPLMLGPESLRCELLQALLDAGADLGVRDHTGYTPLQRCLVSEGIRHRESMRCLKLLVEAGSRLGPDTYSHDRHSPLAWLCFEGWLLKAAYLVNTGWDLTFETWITLPGKTEEQTAMHRALVHHAANPRSLRDLCRLLVRAVLWEHSEHREIISRITRLPVPTVMQAYLMFRDRDYASWDTDLLCPDFKLPPTAPRPMFSNSPV